MGASLKGAGEPHLRVTGLGVGAAGAGVGVATDDGADVGEAGALVGAGGGAWGAQAPATSKATSARMEAERRPFPVRMVSPPFFPILIIHPVKKAKPAPYPTAAVPDPVRNEGTGEQDARISKKGTCSLEQGFCRRKAPACEQFSGVVLAIQLRTAEYPISSMSRRLCQAPAT